MKNLLKYILSLTIISLLTFSVLTKVSLAIPSVPTAPKAPDVPEVPGKPHPPTKPPVPTLPGEKAEPTATPKPGVSPAVGPDGIITTPTPTPAIGIGGPLEEEEEEAEEGKPGEVLGLPAASSSFAAGELITMIAGLIISSFGFRKLTFKG